MFETLVQGPATEPVTISQLATFSRFDVPEAESEEESEVLDQIGAAREHIEGLTNYCFLTQTWRLTLDCFPSLYVGFDNTSAHWNVPHTFPYRPDVIELLRNPVQEVDFVKYLDGDGNEQTLDPATYDLKGNQIVLKVGQSWPATARVPHAVWSEYVAGYDPAGSPAIPVPRPLIRALKFLAGWYYENRIPVSEKPTTEVELTLCNLLTGFRSTYMAR